MNKPDKAPFSRVMIGVLLGFLACSGGLILAFGGGSSRAPRPELHPTWDECSKACGSRLVLFDHLAGTCECAR